jgi:hypothetical protein
MSKPSLFFLFFSLFFCLVSLTKAVARRRWHIVALCLALAICALYVYYIKMPK